MTPEREIKIGVLGATLETPNLGVSTLATGAVGCILHAFADAQVFFLDYGRERTVRTVVAGPFCVRVPLVNLRFSWRLWLPNNIAVLLGLALLLKVTPPRLRPWLAKKNPWLAEICEANLLAAVSGGDSFSDIYGWIRFIYATLPQILAILLGKRLVLLPQTYGPFRNRAARAVARWIVAHAERAWCRDRSSLGRLMGVPASHPRWGERAFAYDLGFAVEPMLPPRMVIEGLAVPCADSKLIGFNVSGLLFQNGYSGKNEFGLRSDYRRLQHDMVHRLLAHHGTRVLLVPHVLGDGASAEDDLAACESIRAALSSQYPGRIGMLRGAYSPSEMRAIVSLCGFFVGSRMHACIAALAQNVPALAVAYSDKFVGVMATLGVDALAADARQLSHPQILEALERAWGARSEIAEQLGRTMPAIRQAAWNLLSALEEASAPGANFRPAPEHPESTTKEGAAMDELLQKLRTFVIDNFLFGRSDEILSDDDSLIENGIIDSTGVMMLVAFLEQKLGVPVADEEIVPDNLDSLRRLAAFAARKLGGNGHQAPLSTLSGAGLAASADAI